MAQGMQNDLLLLVFFASGLCEVVLGYVVGFRACGLSWSIPFARLRFRVPCVSGLRVPVGPWGAWNSRGRILESSPPEKPKGEKGGVGISV